MAWYALWKWFIPFRKTPYVDMIYEYKKYLHQQWFDSLSAEDQQKVLEYRKARKEKRERDAERSLAQMSALIGWLDERSNGAFSMYSRIIGSSILR